jgi:hypothetical protein
MSEACTLVGLLLKARDHLIAHNESFSCSVNKDKDFELIETISNNQFIKNADAVRERAEKILAAAKEEGAHEVH